MINVTDKAKDRLFELRQEEGHSPEHNVRVAVKGGGCSGLMYDMEFDDTISDSDDDVPMNEKEHSLFEKANGQLLYFYLSGPMIFSVSKAIARQHRDISKYKAMVLDLSDVPMLDVTVSLALENAITDALDTDCKVFIFSPNSETSDQLHRFQINEKLGENAFCNSRSDALERALESM